MFTLTLKNVVVNSLKHYEAKTLGAFNHSSCQYQYDDRTVCTAGAGMDQETLDKIKACGKNHTGVFTLDQDGLIETDFMNEISDLQGSHDSWAAALGGEKTERQETYKTKLDELHSKLSEFYPKE